MKRMMALTEMRQGQKGVVRELLGGGGMKQRLDGIGIRPGQEVVKTGGLFLRGPVTVRVGNAQIALGFGMARRVIVEAEEGGER